MVGTEVQIGGKMLFQQVNKNTPERIWMVFQNFDANSEDMVEGNLVCYVTGTILDVGKEVMGLRVTKSLSGVTPKTAAGVVRRGSKTVKFGEFGIMQVYGFFDGVLTDGAVVPADSAIVPSLTVAGTVNFGSDVAATAFLSIGRSLIGSTEYIGGATRCGVMLNRLM